MKFLILFLTQRLTPFIIKFSIKFNITLKKNVLLEYFLVFEYKF